MDDGDFWGCDVILVLAMFDDDDDNSDFHHIIHLLKIIGVPKFGGSNSKEVNTQ